jgi:hypothetical protein
MTILDDIVFETEYLSGLRFLRFGTVRCAQIGKPLEIDTIVCHDWRRDEMTLLRHGSRLRLALPLLFGQETFNSP